ncbi:MAG: GspE/PulE family protein [Armatimonadetes bacterium]|nr:GspE/PulE family protein [Armatimonadota bacterium]MCX7967891.1 GspE/PulE family protein [Armatimonadota bacterium]MDW8143753.1 GspE/PulE family protein [Armatimonadota bacterium]
MQAPTMRRTVLDVLKEQGKLTDEQIQAVLQAQQQAVGQPIERIVVDLGFVSETDVLAAQARLLNVQYVDLNKVRPDESAISIVLSKVPADYLRQKKCIPIRIEQNRLWIAMANPRDIMTIDELRTRIGGGLVIVPLLASQSQIEAALGELPAQSPIPTPAAPPSGRGTGFGFSVDDLLKQIDSERYGGETTSGPLAGQIARVDAADAEVAQEAPIIRLVDTILREAIRNEATDIHIEPLQNGVRIRYRIDGILHEVLRLPKWLSAPLVARIKILGDMDVAEKRVPQDGRMRIEMQKKRFDVRISTIPTVNGEKAVLRLLDQSSPLMGLERLGLWEDDLAKVEYLMSQPYGMILSTGPTGSGKTTTQYSILHRLNTNEVNILTIEDPVEYEVQGINQVHVNRKAGVTFATALRAFLRQDPDIILVGEIRDLETADVAFQAALTGHLVLSTLHTNDAPTAATRLIEMGVEPFLISAAVIGVIAQRLARRVCSNCKEPYKYPEEVLMRFGVDLSELDGRELYRGKGCEACRYTGYKGRIGIFEVFVMNTEIADLILRRAPISEIRDAAVASGMTTLLRDGWRKVLAGVTTPQEVLRVVTTVGY